jgi:ligand-binding sensor domain-containing protein
MKHLTKFLFFAFLTQLQILPVLGQLSNRIHEQFHFKYITVDDGLNNNRVRGLAQDKFGFIWIGTSKGVARFDGYSVVNYTNYITDTGLVNFEETRAIHTDKEGTLWSVGIYGICYFDWAKNAFVFFTNEELEQDINYCGELGEDSKGNLWFATRIGIVKYNPVTREIQLFPQEDNNPKAPRTGRLEKLIVTSKDHVWYGYARRGVGYYIPEKDIFRHFRSTSDPETPAEDRVERLYEDKDGNIWVGHNNNGASKYNYTTSTFTRYMPEPNRKESGRVRGIIEDSQGNFWFGTQAGLYLFDRNIETFRRYAYAEHPISTLSHNSIQTMMVDNQEGLWIGTFAGGVSYTNLNSSGIVKYEYSKIPSEYYLSDKSVYALAFDNHDNIWVGTENGGLNYLDRTSGKFTYLQYDPFDTNTIRSNNIKSIYVDKEGIVWIGTYKGKMSKYNPSDSLFTHYQKTDEYPQGFDDESIFIIQPDVMDDNILWICSTNKLYMFNKETEEKTEIKPDSTDFTNVPEFSRVNSICNTTDSKMIFGSDKIMILDRSAGNFKDISTINNIRISQVDFVLIDKHGFLWAAINTSFIVRYDLQKSEALVFDHSKGLPEIDYLQGAEDADGNLWISSNKGIWKLENIIENQDTFNIVHYDKSDNVQSLEFLFHSKAVNPSGEILFGGINGFNSLIPQKVKPNPYVPNVVVTKLLIAGDEVGVGEKIGGKVICDKPIMEMQKLHFNHKIKVFTFHFAGLHYVAPENNKFKYKLEGYDKDWQYTDAHVRSATYSNIPRGNYVFKVDASNNNGKWSEKPFSFQVRVTPPFWKTIWFLLLIMVLIGIIIYVLVQFRENQLKRDKEILEKELNKGKEEIEKSRNEIERTRLALEEKEQQETIQKWHNKGLARFSEILTREKDDLVKLSQDLINNLVEYTGVQQGGIFLEKNDGKGEVKLELVANYAFSSEMLEKKIIMLGEGQVGACYANKKMIQVDKLPDSYIKLSSGLGESGLPYLLIMPIVYDEQAVGVLELASFEKVEDYKIEFLRKINESIVSVVSNLKANEIIQEMLDKSKIQAEELISQEEEMRQNMEEMMATQEEASRRERVLKDEIEKQKERCKELEAKLKKK